MSETEVTVTAAPAPQPQTSSTLPARLPDSEIFPCFGNTDLMAAAYRQFMVTDKSLGEIADSIGVPEVTVLRWAAVQSWDEERERTLAVKLRDSRQRLAAWRAEQREASARRHVEIGRKILQAVGRQLEDEDGNPVDQTADQLKKTADAGKAGADMEARAVGINDNEAAAEPGAQSGSQAAAVAQGRKPLVIVIPGGGLPFVKRDDAKPADEGKTYDV